LLFLDNGNDVTLWSKFKEEADMLHKTRKNPQLDGVIIPESIKILSSIDDAVENAEAVVIAVPSFAVRETAEALKGKLNEECLVLCMSKGIEKDTSSLFTDILQDVLGSNARIAAVSGPTHAEEVSRRIPTGCVAASVDIKIAEIVQSMLMNDYMRVYTSTDVIGVELGAALKNVIAICVGVCEGLGFGDNTIAMLMTRGLAEMAELCVKMGGRKETLAGLTGLGDLIVTCMSRHSRNRRAGVLIGKGMSTQDAMNEVGAIVEGYYAAKAAMELSVAMQVDMPICIEAYKVMHEGKSVNDGFRDLMSRRKKSEDNAGEERWVVQ
jgi:glycerol-3-phosphate dehydrogenase (NAD(P)+)